MFESLLCRRLVQLVYTLLKQLVSLWETRMAARRKLWLSLCKLPFVLATTDAQTCSGKYTYVFRILRWSTTTGSLGNRPWLPSPQVWWRDRKDHKDLGTAGRHVPNQGSCEPLQGQGGDMCACVLPVQFCGSIQACLAQIPAFVVNTNRLGI